MEMQDHVRYPLMEAFYTLQGEGYYQGQAAYFIRLAGCDVGCPWCDVKESWEASDHPQVLVSDIVASANKVPARLAVITGGEPLMYDLQPLTLALLEAGFSTNIETSGAYPISGTWDWICLSPKKFKPAHPSVISAANELKVIVYHKSDFEFAEQYAKEVSPACQLYLQPEWSKREEMIPLITEYCMAHPQWQVSLQLHKYMNIP
ncbi:MAG: 7-carboxy-7-deazaguanine synthase QueE [Cytophagaceae bacterium]|jgi:organic radical activating enzyme|nr:7-carboxy-7-deazaguanine synthase QueE [Cytophagaceae bacterium]